MSMPEGRGPGQPWYHEPLMWLVVGVPALTVMGGIATLLLATKGGDAVVRDDFRREGLAIHADPARDAAAVEAGAQATLTFDRAAGHLSVVVGLKQGQLPDRLLIVLSHATRAELDRRVSLRRANGAYDGRLESLPAGRWCVELMPPSRSWRLRGEFSSTQRSVELRAARGR